MVRGHGLGVPLVAEHVVRQQTFAVVRHTRHFRGIQKHEDRAQRVETRRTVRPAREQVQRTAAAHEDESNGRLLSDLRAITVFTPPRGYLARRRKSDVAGEKIPQRPSGNA